MGRYGIDYYGVGKYGPITPVEFNADPFLAKSVGYGEIKLTWNSPTGDWDEIRLVRNSYGFPLDPDDGDLIYSDIKALDAKYYDDLGLQEGRTYYYSIFVLQTGTTNWIRAANAYGVSVKNFNTYEAMYNYLPIVYRQVGTFVRRQADPVNDPTLYTSDVDNTDLQDFLRLFAFEYDLEKTYSYNLMYAYDTTFVDGRYIPQMMKQFGLSFEPEIGLKQSRILLRNALKIYKNKGSRDGFITYLKAATGYDLDLEMGKNLFLSLDDSSFEEGINFWSATNATLDHADNGQYGVTAYSEPTAPSSYPNGILGFMRCVTTVAGTVSLDCGNSTPITKGIPVTAGLAYSFSIWARAASTARTVTASISWYDSRGVLISTDNGTGISVTNTGAWNIRPKVENKIAPTNAVFAIPKLSIASAVIGNTFYFDAAQFEQSATATDFEDARILHIYFKASRKNELSNPNFETNSVWTATGGTLVLASSIVGAPTKLGEALVLRPTAVSSAATVKSEEITLPSVGADNYAFSVYARFLNEGANPTAQDQATLKVEWRDASHAVLSTTTGTATALTTSSWTRLEFVTTSPATAAYAVAKVEWTPNASTSVSLILDEALFEKSAFVNEYFDGTTGVVSLSNLFWEGTVNASKSHLYINRAVIESRVATDIPNYLYPGTKFRFYFAQP